MMRIWKVAAGLLLLSCVQGCAYMHNRANDLMDMVDLGISYSSTPGFAIYADICPVLPLGYGKVKGSFVGIGDGQLCVGAPYYLKSAGVLLWGEERIAFGTDPDILLADKQDEVTHYQRVGALGIAQGPFPGPAYFISCEHYVHLGWVGLVLTIRYWQMVDFLVGWTTLDPGNDDDRDRPLMVGSNGGQGYAPKASSKAAPAPTAPPEAPAGTTK
jgi:hypothetical protein